jgi:hypothetical protein
MAKKQTAEIDPVVKTPAEESPALEAPILPGHEDAATLRTVTLIGNGPADSTYRVETPIPQTLAVNGARYILSDRAAGVYIWQHP